MNISVNDNNQIVNADNDIFALVDNDKIIFYNGCITSIKINDIKTIRKGILKNQIIVNLTDGQIYEFYPKLEKLIFKDIIDDGTQSSFRELLIHGIPGINEDFLFLDEVSHSIKIDSSLIGCQSHKIIKFDDNVLTDIIYLLENYALSNFKKRYKYDDNVKWRVINEIAKKHTRNMFLEYIDGIIWDGVPRIDTLLSELGFSSGLQNIDNDCLYMTTVSRSLFLSVIDRQLNNVKVDFVPVFISKNQGVGKSTFCEKLALYDSYNGTSGDDFYRPCSLKDISDTKKLCEHINGGVIVEFIEGISLKSDRDDLKALIDKTKGQFRETYAKKESSIDFKFNIVVTTNQEQFLTDYSGNRRYFPVEYEGIVPPLMDMKTDLTIDYMKQCWAEALTRFRNGEKWQPAIENIKKMSEIVQRGRTIRYPGCDELHDLLNDEYTTIGQKISIPELRVKLYVRTDLTPHDLDELFKKLRLDYANYGLSKVKNPWKDDDGKSIRGYRMDNPDLNKPIGYNEEL